MNTKQKVCIVLIIIGTGGFFFSLGEFFKMHQTWSELSGPSEVGHLLVLIGTFITALGGALRYEWNINLGSVSVEKLRELKGDKDGL